MTPFNIFLLYFSLAYCLFFDWAMVLRTGPNRPVTVPVRSGQLHREAIGPELNHLNQRFDQRTGRTGRFPPDPTVHFPSPFLMRLVPPLSLGASSGRQWYLRCRLEHHPAGSTPGAGNPAPPPLPHAEKPSQPRQHPAQIPSPHPRGGLENSPISSRQQRALPPEVPPTPRKLPSLSLLCTIGKVAFHFGFLKFNSLSPPPVPMAFHFSFLKFYI